MRSAAVITWFAVNYKTQILYSGFIFSPWASQEDNVLLTIMSKDMALKSKSKQDQIQSHLLQVWGQQGLECSSILS